MPRETLNLVLDDFGGRLGPLGARPTPNALIARRRSAIYWTSNDRVPMSDNTLSKALRITGCDTGQDGDHCAHAFRLTASTLLN